MGERGCICVAFVVSVIVLVVFRVVVVFVFWFTKRHEFRLRFIV